VKFLVDAQLPRRSSHVLRSAGHDSIHTLDLPQGNATADGEVARRSGAESRVVVSHLLRGEAMSGQPIPDHPRAKAPGRLIRPDDP
jgi:hypothetical protein